MRFGLNVNHANRGIGSGNWRLKVKFKTEKEGKIIVKSEEGRPPGVPGPIPDCYGPSRKSLSDFALSDEARQAIEARRRARHLEAQRLREYFGFDPPSKSWWETD